MGHRQTAPSPPELSSPPHTEDCLTCHTSSGRESKQNGSWPPALDWKAAGLSGQWGPDTDAQQTFSTGPKRLSLRRADPRGPCFQGKGPVLPVSQEEAISVIQGSRSDGSDGCLPGACWSEAPRGPAQVERMARWLTGGTVGIPVYNSVSVRLRGKGE